MTVNIKSQAAICQAKKSDNNRDNSEFSNSFYYDKYMVILYAKIRLKNTNFMFYTRNGVKNRRYCKKYTKSHKMLIFC